MGSRSRKSLSSFHKSIHVQLQLAKFWFGLPRVEVVESVSVSTVSSEPFQMLHRSQLHEEFFSIHLQTMAQVPALLLLARRDPSSGYAACFIKGGGPSPAL